MPGDDAWESKRARLLSGCHVSVVFDCDRAGRQAAPRIAADLRAAGVPCGIVDAARARTDGHDLTEWLAERESLGAQDLRRALGAPGARTRARCRRLAGEGRRLLGELARLGVRRLLLGWLPRCR